jgi:hypothetical protein
MNRSYSKIRHIQESNIRLEKRLFNEQLNTNGPEGPKEGDEGVYCIKNGDNLSVIANKFKGQHGLSKDNPISDIMAYNPRYREYLSKHRNKLPVMGGPICLYLYAAG